MKKENYTTEKRKVGIVITSRASYGRVKSVMQAIQKHPDLELQLIVGASALLYRFGSAIEVIRNNGFEPDAKMYSVVEGENPTTMAKSTGLAILELATLFENLEPDVVITVADRYETMATAISACYTNIPLAHMQGGEITGSIDDVVRHAVTRLAHVHFPATRLSMERLIKMGEEPDTIHLVGCPSIDVIANIDLNLGNLFECYGGTGAPINPKEPYIVVLQHPVTTEYGQGLDQINETLRAVVDLNMQTVWIWPNIDAGSDDLSKGLRMFREKNKSAPIHFYRNFSVEDYARLINNCACLVGNSSSAIREGAFLGVPAVNIGTRQRGRERGENVIDVGYDRKEILEAIRYQLDNGKYQRNTLYGDGKAGQRIADVLANCELTINKKLTY